MDIGIYPLITSRFLLDADPVAVRGTVASVQEEFADVPDEHGAFQLDFPGHVYAVCTASQNAHLDSHISVLETEGKVRVEPACYHRDDRGSSRLNGGRRSRSTSIRSTRWKRSSSTSPTAC